MSPSSKPRRIITVFIRQIAENILITTLFMFTSIHSFKKSKVNEIYRVGQKVSQLIFAITLATVSQFS